MHLYLIRSLEEVEDDGSPSWWSNESGWADLGQAVVFTEAETLTSRLPLTGEWVRFTES